MKSLRQLTYALCIAMFLSVSSLVARADDPPGRAVDIRYISGQVSIQPGGVDDWVGAVVNRPLTTSDRVWTDRDSRTELKLGTAALRLNSETSLTLTNVSDETVQVELDQGTLNVRVRRLYGGEIYEVDTPNLAFTLTRAGVYRFDVDADQGTTRVSVFKGEGEATGEGNAVNLRAGEQADFSNGTSLENQIYRLGRSDGFDDWARLRDDREDRSPSYRYVSQDMVGADDLDQYGTWRNDPEYGSMWVPSHVESGWAPYHDGHWAWVEPWGWTWVDDAPWGYAPCHYGRWVYRDNYWGWTPGPLDVRPVYAPALVAWVGGAAFGASVSFGGGEGVGWFPLGYGEPYVPSYAVSRQYFENVNTSNTRITNITNVTNNYYNNNTYVANNNVTNIKYVNQNVPGAVIAVPRSAMVNAQPVSRAAVRVPANAVARTAVVTAPPVAPQRNSVLGAKAGAPAAAPPPQAAAPRAVVTKTAPPPRPVPFAEKQDALAKNPGKPLDTQAVQQIRARLPQPPPPARPANTGSGRPNGQPPSNAGAPAANAPANRNAGAPPERPNTPPERNSANPNGGNNNPNAGGPGRNVPRPPNTNAPGNNGQQPANNSRPANNTAQPPVNTDRSVQRPNNNQPNNNQPGAERTSPNTERAPANNGPGGNSGNRPVPRPPDAERNAPPPQRPQASPQSRPEPPVRNEAPAQQPAARPSQPERNAAPPPREQAQPQNRPEPPARNEAPPERPAARPPQPERNAAPPPREQAQPQNRPQPPARNEAPPERPAARPPQPERNAAPPPREQAQPQNRPQPPARNEAPPERPAARPPQPERNTPPAREQQPPPKRPEDQPPQDRQ